MSKHYCVYKDGMCELDVDESYQQGRAEAEEEAEKRMQSILDDEKRLSYVKGRADMLDSIMLAVKDEYYCLEDLCGESIDCSDCLVNYLKLLKEQMNDGTNDNKS